MTEPSQTWWSAGELAAIQLPGIPASRRAVDALIARDGWRSHPDHARRRSGRGGGWEYHWSLLPEAARKRLLQEAAAAAPGPEAVAEAPQDAAYERASPAARARAADRLRILDAVASIMAATGVGKNAAVEMVAAQEGVGARSIWFWLGLTDGVDRAHWLARLTPRKRGGATGRKVEVSSRFMELVKADYLRLEAPSFASVYRRVCQIAKQERLNAVPAQHVVRRRLKEEVPEVVMVYAREGTTGLARKYPPQIRDRSELSATEAVNADCHRFDVFVRWPRGNEFDIVRPQIVAFQDVYSGKILSWRIDRTPNKVMVMAAWSDLIRDWGIPKHCLFDNGREFANKWLTGGAPTRFRFKVREDEALGALSMLGVKIHWATPGHGQAKPVERAFRDLSEDISKDPRFAGAYVGRRPDAKPENYGSTAVELDEFVEVVAAGIAEHNARGGRTAPVCRGRSFDDTFAESYQADKVTKATPEQIRLCLMAQQEVTPDRNHGRIRYQQNHYYAPWLMGIAGKKVVARFDPERLQDGLHIFDAEGTFLGEAPCQSAVGFFDEGEAHAIARQRRGVEKAARELKRKLSDLGAEDVADAMRKLSPRKPEAVEAKVLEGRFGEADLPRGLPKMPKTSVPAEDAAETAAREAFVADFQKAREARRVDTSPQDEQRARFTRALRLTQASEAGEIIGDEEAAWLKGYRRLPEWDAQLKMYEQFGEAMLAK